MCEQTPVEYKNGDVVWVKLGSCWWPGEVQDIENLSEDEVGSFRKPIIAAVKFFDEDYYEFIKSLDRIYLYNCSKKNEFIRKGLDLHRAKHDYMKKFPEDVSKAEIKTNGNPDIIEDPMFAPEKKTNIAALIFGSSKQKKTPKRSVSNARKSLGLKSTNNSPKPSPNRIITHPRFLGKDDHEVRILVQSSEQQKPEFNDDKIVYKCAACGFSTERIDVSIIHHKSHIQGDYRTPLTSPKKNKRTYTKRNKKVFKMTKSKTTSIIEDLDLIDRGMMFQTESSDDDTLNSSCESEPEIKRRKRRTKKKETIKKDKKEDKTPGTVVDIRDDLLAEWDEEESSSEKDVFNSSTETLELELTTQNKRDEVTEEKEKVDIEAKVEDKSCFDFDENEEEEIVETSVGRKIPRVIPPPDRQKSTDSDEIESNIISSENNTDSTEDTLTQSTSEDISTQDSSQELIAVTEKKSKDEADIDTKTNQTEDKVEDDKNKNKNENKSANDDNCTTKPDKHDVEDLAFKDILEATTMPELPEIPHPLKFEQNFHDSKKIKFPDKTTESPIKTDTKDQTEVPSRLINPKKRFVKSFEDFELQIYNEQKRLRQSEQDDEQKRLRQSEQDDEQKRLRQSEQADKLQDDEQKRLQESEQTDKLQDNEQKRLRESEQTDKLQDNEQKRLWQSEQTEQDDEQKRLQQSEETDKLQDDEQKRLQQSEETDKLQDDEQKRLQQSEQTDKLQNDEQTDKLQNDEQSEKESNVVIISDDTEEISIEKKIEKPTVEVSKLKTQLMFKLGNSEPRPRLFRDRILSNHKEVEEEVPTNYLPDDSVNNVTEFHSSKHFVSPPLPQKMCELPEELLESCGSTDTHDLLPTISILETNDTFEKNDKKYSVLSPVPAEVPYVIESQDVGSTVLDKPEEDETYNFKHSFSIKMPEINETKPVEMKVASELLELEEKMEMEPIQLEPMQVLEDEGAVEPMQVVQVEPVINAQSEVMDVVDIHEIEQTQESLSNETTEPIEPSATGDVIDQTKQLIAEEQMNTSSILEKPTSETDKTDDINITDETKIVDSSASLEPNISFSCTSVNAQNTEDLSALTTLATISELSTNLDIHCTSSEKSKLIENNLTSCADIKDKSNLNFVTMDDLAEGQVEISDTAISKVKAKPINLMSFSVDFSDSNEATNITPHSENLSATILESSEHLHQPDSIEMSLGKVFEGESDSTITSEPLKTKGDTIESFGSNTYDVEDEIPSLLVCSSPPIKKAKSKIMEKNKPEYSSSSKLLEILTDGKTKPTSNIDTSPQKSPVINTWAKEEKGFVSQKDSSSLLKTLSRPKEERLLNALQETSPITKTSKNKEDKLFTVTKEAPSVTKVLSKGKDNKLYTITKESTISKSPPKYESKNSKFILKSSPTLKPFASPPTTKTNKPIILSEKIIKTLSEPSETVSVQKVTSKRTTQDVEDIDTFIIQKPTKKITLQEEPEVENLPKKIAPSKGKAKILQQTIIKPSGDIIQPVPSIDDSMFDINSMPIVLGDQILTTEGIENMPVVLSEAKESTTVKPQGGEQKILNKTVTTQPMLLKTYSSQKLGKSRIYQTAPTSATKILKSNPAVISRPGKQDKYIILPSSSTPTTSKYTVGKKQNIAKRMTPVVLPTPTVAPKIQTTTNSESSGNKIMIVTNQQGQQSRVLLTPAQQKLFGYQSTGSSKLVKSTLKGNILQKTNTKSPIISASSSASSKVVNSQDVIISSNQTSAINTEPLLMPIKTSSPLRNKALSSKGGKFQQQKVSLQESLSTFKGQQKTIVIKNQQGQIVKKFHGTDDAFLEQQVAEQVQAIKASGSFSSVNKIKPALKRSYKKPEAQKNVKFLNASTSKMLKNDTLPPLAPISPKKSDSLLLPQTILKTTENKIESTKAEPTQQKQLNQLIIQDALGNQTTIMEGQILALPSGDTVDGQPQSYMLVTLDETGNLTPLNNEALLSLDPNLTLGGDLSNMVLQLDENTNKKLSSLTEPSNENSKVQESPQVSKEENVIEAPKIDNESLTGAEPQNVQTVTCSIGNDPNQQLIITGDPISTQKFIESLTEGNPDLANLLASAEGNILIQTDEQQILINTDSDNQVLLPINAGVMESNESDGNPIFSTPPLKNQDILAAALADTDVFQQEQSVSPVHGKMGQAQLSPNSGLYQVGVSNVLETTLSLSSPIMTPLEVPSTNNKKIPDEEMDILTTEVPKNVDLPITITDPNISQTVAQQQVVSLIATELSTNLDLPLTIAESSVTPLTSAEMNSPSFGYSTLDDSVTSIDVQKPFSGPISMPLLTEDPQETTISNPIVEESDMPPEQIIEEKHEEIITLQEMPNERLEDEASLPVERKGSLKKELFENSALTDSIIKDDAKSPSKSFLGTSLETEEGLCTLGGAMCSSLSEPPPDMFDLSLVGSHYVTDNEIKSSISSSIQSEGSPINESTDSIDQVESTNELNDSNDTFNKYDSYEVKNKSESSSILNAPQNSSSNSPVVNVDENSCEIPVQPQIVTDLSSTSFECMDVDDYESNKRVDSDYDTESERKKIEFD